VGGSKHCATNTKKSGKHSIKKDSNIMISLNFNLRNPWSTTFKNLWCRVYHTPFKNKFIELEVFRVFTLISFTFNWTIRQSHAGLDIEAGLLGYCLHFNFYDNRHWDGNSNRWET
jgi:hypothetical protein